VNIFNAGRASTRRRRPRRSPASNIPVGVYTTLVAGGNRGLPVLHTATSTCAERRMLVSISPNDIYPPVRTSDRKFGNRRERGD